MKQKASDSNTAVTRECDEEDFVMAFLQDITHSLNGESDEN
jgi:hypothetical protein